MNAPELVVGIDGSPHSERALTWAAHEAARRGAAVLVIHAYDYPVAAATPIAASTMADIRAQAEELVAAAVANVRASAPGVPVRGEATFGSAAHALVTASAGGATVVVGNRGRGGFASLLLGSVSQQVALHAHGPVVVVRGRPDAAEGPVLIGVDGSRESQQALALGFEAAAARGTDVLAVRAYTPATSALAMGLPGYLEDPQERREAERAALGADVAPWAEKYPHIRVRRAALVGHPADLLTRQSSTASLVVVGNRGRGGVSGLLLGSVGLHLLHHADCPVLIARAVS